MNDNSVENFLSHWNSGNWALERGTPYLKENRDGLDGFEDRQVHEMTETKASDQEQVLDPTTLHH